MLKLQLLRRSNGSQERLGSAPRLANQGARIRLRPQLVTRWVGLAELSAALAVAGSLIPRLPSGECGSGRPGVGEQWFDGLLHVHFHGTSWSRDGKEEGGRISHSWEGTFRPCVPLHCRCPNVCLFRTLPSCRLGAAIAFQRASRAGGFLSLTPCENGGPKSFS